MVKPGSMHRAWGLHSVGRMACTMRAILIPHSSFKSVWRSLHETQKAHTLVWDLRELSP